MASLELINDSVAQGSWHVVCTFLIQDQCLPLEDEAAIEHLVVHPVDLKDARVHVVELVIRYAPKIKLFTIPRFIFN